MEIKSGHLNHTELRQFPARRVSCFNRGEINGREVLIYMNPVQPQKQHLKRVPIRSQTNVRYD